MNLVLEDGSITQPFALILSCEASHFDLRSGCAYSCSSPQQEGQPEARDFWAANGLWRTDGQLTDSQVNHSTALMPGPHGGQLLSRQMGARSRG